jgi:hypothetical protein
MDEDQIRGEINSLQAEIAAAENELAMMHGRLDQLQIDLEDAMASHDE